MNPNKVKRLPSDCQATPLQIKIDKKEQDTSEIKKKDKRRSAQRMNGKSVKIYFECIANKANQIIIGKIFSLFSIVKYK